MRAFRTARLLWAKRIGKISVATRGPFHTLLMVLFGPAGMVNVVNGVIAGVFVGLAIKAAFGSTLAVCTVSGVGVFFVTVAL